MVQGPHCDGCPQQPIGVHRLTADGLGTSGVLIAGDSPWQEEMLKLRPFAGPSGYLLERVFNLLGVSRQSFLITNSAIQCKPPHLGWTDHPERFPDAARAIEHCRPYFDETVAAMQPKVIVTLGNVALERVAGVSGLDARHSYVHASPYGVPVVPSYHPSFILQGNGKYTSVLLFALQRALEIAKGHFKPSTYELLLDPPLEAANRYLDHVKGAEEVICDIETPSSSKVDEEEAEEDASYTIVRISFSTRSNSGISMPWAPPYIEPALRVLREARRLVFWNQSFDMPRLLAAGASPTGTVVDAMWAWHFLQSDLPKSLGFVAPFYYSGGPWKHLADAQPPYYSAMDAAVTRTVYEGVRADLIQQGRWDAFERHCVRITPILTRMGERGLQVDTTAREAFMSRLQAEYTDTHRLLQSAISDNLKGRKKWKRAPKDLTGVTEIPTDPSTL